MHGLLVLPTKALWISSSQFPVVILSVSSFSLYCSLTILAGRRDGGLAL